MSSESNFAIVGLVKGHKHLWGYSDLIRRNYLIKENIPNLNDIDIILFTEGDIKSEHKKVINRYSPSVDYIDVSGESFLLPKNLNKKSIKNIGYKNMCRFNAIKIWKYVKNYDYIMRLDDDSFIEKPIEKDIFEWAKKNKYDHLYVRYKKDTHDITKKTLPDFTRQYVSRENIDKRTKMDIDSYNFYNNFYITRVNFWLKKEVQSFLNHVDKSMGIYEKRWGDSTIQAHALKIFSEKEKLKKIRDIYYTHGSHGWSNFKRKYTEHFKNELVWEWTVPLKEYLRSMIKK